MDTMTSFATQLDFFLQDIDGHFNGTKTQSQARQDFLIYRDMVLTSIPTMSLDLLRQEPAIAATGFLGKLKFSNHKRLKFEDVPTAEWLQEVRKNNDVQVAESARTAWRYVVEKDEQAASIILGLCVRAGAHPHIKNLSKSL